MATSSRIGRPVRFLPLRGMLAASLLCAMTTAAFADEVKITVDATPAQTYRGFGAGVGNWDRDYQRLTAEERQTLARHLWRDLRMRSIRLWVNLDEVAPTPGQCRTQEFRERYVDSGLLSDARAEGVSDVLLAPDGMPTYMKVKRDGAGNAYALRDDAIDAYATLIADFIAALRRDAGVAVTVTGVQNEPNEIDRIAPEQMPRVVTALRAALDARGLRDVGVVAPEGANVDAVYFETLDRLRADAAAWRALAGVASHSYSMGATDDAARRVGAGMSYWMTEASDNGPEAPGDAERAASLASRFLGDLNHGVTHWLHFIGFERPDPKDDATRILAFETKPLRITTFRKYDSYRALAATFDAGCVLRRATSDLDRDMPFTYGPKPRVSVAVGRNPDGSWAIGISNFTAARFKAVPDEGGSDNGYAARTFDVTIAMPELAATQAIDFAVTRTLGNGKDVVAETMTMHAGRFVVPGCGPLDVVTLRSAPR